MVNVQSLANSSVIDAAEAATSSGTEQRMEIEEGSVVETVEINQENDTDDESDADSESWQDTHHNHVLISRVQSMLSDGFCPADILRHIFPSIQVDLNRFTDATNLRIIYDVIDSPPVRVKLPQYNTLQDAIELFRTKKSILMLTGAGVSVSCGIPDFRSENGIYARLHKDFPDLPDPTSMFDIKYFHSNPAPFFDFAKEIFPGQFNPSISHRFIKVLEDNGQLLRNYTQNIDTLERQAGIQNVVECHGSFSKATCTKCQKKYDGNEIKEDVMKKQVAYCKVCKDGVIKPDIVFFGEDLGKTFHRQMTRDKDKVDLVVVIGSSLKVRPVSLIPFSVKPDVPQILINRESLPNYRADIELLGNCDEIIREICNSLGNNFLKMIEDYDEIVANKNEKGEIADNEEIKKRNVKKELIELEDFMKRMDEYQNEEKCEETEAKRPRLDDGALLQMRYIKIEKTLPPNTCAKVSENQTVFPGAEFVYDLEKKIVCRPPNRHYCDQADDDDEASIEDEDEEERDEDELIKTKSTNNLLLDDEVSRLSEIHLNRCESCPPHLKYEESEKYKPRFVKNLWRQIEEN